MPIKLARLIKEGLTTKNWPLSQDDVDENFATLNTLTEANGAIGRNLQNALPDKGKFVHPTDVYGRPSQGFRVGPPWRSNTWDLFTEAGAVNVNGAGTGAAADLQTEQVARGIVDPDETDRVGAWYVAERTMTGISGGSVALQISNNMEPTTSVVDGALTFICWVRVVSGTIEFDGDVDRGVFRDGIAIEAGDLGPNSRPQLTSADGWTHVCSFQDVKRGQFSLNALYAVGATTFQVALPAVVNAKVIIPPHGWPIQDVALSHAAAANNPNISVGAQNSFEFPNLPSTIIVTAQPPGGELLLESGDIPSANHRIVNDTGAILTVELEVGGDTVDIPIDSAISVVNTGSRFYLIGAAAPTGALFEVSDSSPNETFTPDGRDRIIANWTGQIFITGEETGQLYYTGPTWLGADFTLKLWSGSTITDTISPLIASENSHLSGDAPDVILEAISSEWNIKKSSSGPVSYTVLSNSIYKNGYLIILPENITENNEEIIVIRLSDGVKMTPSTLPAQLSNLSFTAIKVG